MNTPTFQDDLIPPGLRPHPVPWDSERTLPNGTVIRTWKSTVMVSFPWREDPAR